MPQSDWTREFPGAVTVCDRDGVILEMNDKSALTFAADGGKELIGKNIMDCHPAKSHAKIRELLAGGVTNTYTIEKNGVKKLIYQAPWYQDGVQAGLVELSIEIPFEMEHFIRK